MELGALIDYLKAESVKGVSHVYLDDQAKDAIRTAIKAQRATPVSPQATQAMGVSPSRPVPAPSAPAKSLSTPAPRKETPAPHTPAAAQRVRPSEGQPVEKVSPESIPLDVPAGDVATQISSLKKLAEEWAPAQSLGTLKRKMVFSSGTPETDIVLVGEAPGFKEELEGAPFMGPAGEKLDKILMAMGLNREALYITYICKFRPSLPGQTTNNRKPNAEEMASCMPLVIKELEVIQPKCIIALGASAAEALTGQVNAPVGRLRGSWYEFQGIPLRVTYHPSYLLRNEQNNTEKRKLWEDMLAVMEKLEMPISEKQKGYFLKK